MAHYLNDLENILNQEQQIFNQVYQLEEEKSEAIITRDGNLLQSLSNTQEKQLTKIQPLEKKRNKIIGQFRKKYGFEESEELTLKDIVSSDNFANSNDKIIAVGAKLSTTLHKMKNLQDTNRKLMEDNIEFYDILIRELKESVSLKTGYSEKGLEKEEVANSLIFNKTV